jgi:hypothetical protein
VGKDTIANKAAAMTPLMCGENVVAVSREKLHKKDKSCGKKKLQG